MAEPTIDAAARALRANVQTQREYETIYLLQADLTQEQIDRVKERVRGIVDREGGRVIKFTTWGKKKTAFPIRKQARSLFVHANFLGDGRAVSEVERNLRNLEEVTKFQTVKLSDAVLPESRPSEADVVLEGDREEEPRPAVREAREGESTERVAAAPVAAAAPAEEASKDAAEPTTKEVEA